MGSKEWFENSSKKTGLTMFGTFVIIASTMFAIFFIIAISAKIHERSIASFNASQMMPIHKEYLEEMTPTIANMVDEIRPSNKDNSPNRDMVFCTYCGYENRRDARYCNHCGNKMDWYKGLLIEAFFGDDISIGWWPISIFLFFI